MFMLGARRNVTQAASSLQACEPSISCRRLIINCRQKINELLAVIRSKFSSNLIKLDDDGYADIDWSHLGFGLVPTDYMYIMKCSNGDSFQQGQLCRYGNIELSPSAGVLNYGQGLFEGTKVYRREDGGLFLFRPDQNAIRMQIGAERMCMPSPSVEQFINSVKQTAIANKRWIPPPGIGSLYIRPLFIGSGPVLGMAPSPEYTFLVYASPVGNGWFKGTSPLKLYVENEIHRATRGGAGGVKSITNYAPVLKAMQRAKAGGFSDVLYLDSVDKRNIQEVSSCNIFIVKGNVLATPAATGTILEGVTRKSIMDIASDLGYQNVPFQWMNYLMLMKHYAQGRPSVLLPWEVLHTMVKGLNTSCTLILFARNFTPDSEEFKVAFWRTRGVGLWKLRVLDFPPQSTY